MSPWTSSWWPDRGCQYDATHRPGCGSRARTALDIAIARQELGATTAAVPRGAPRTRPWGTVLVGGEPAAGPRASRGLSASPARPGGSELPPGRRCDALAPPAASLPAAWASLEGFESSTLDERGRESRTPGPPPPRSLRRHDRQVSSSSRPCGNGPGARSARPLLASLGRGRRPGAACAAPPGRCAPRGRGGVCAPAPAARAAPRGDAPVRRAHRLTLPQTHPPRRAKTAALAARARLHGACPRLRRRTAPAPTPARSSWGARSLDGGGLRCEGSPDRGGLGSLRREPEHRSARPWVDGRVGYQAAGPRFRRGGVLV